MDPDTVGVAAMGRKTLIQHNIPVCTRCGRQARQQTTQIMGLGMAGRVLKSWIVAGLTWATLSGCEPGTGGVPLTEAAGGTAQPATSVRLVDHDVEAPEVFQTEAKALWDGRPSLGGVWVASADAKNPERVIMRNPANGKFVIGGLFQRDATLPGPKLQLSSDAADALGLLAGQPSIISVTALRREEAQAAAPDASKPLLDANEAVAAAPQTGAVPKAASKAEALATETAALDAANNPTAPTAKPGSKPSLPTQPVAKPKAEPKTKPAAQPATEAAAQAVAPTASGSGALIQIGIFSIEANAKRASDLLSKAGIQVNTTKESSHGKELWSVTVRGDAALLGQIKAAGFKDAYVLKR